MDDWRISGMTVEQARLEAELQAWLSKVPVGVYLFREGATLCELDWGNASLLTSAELDRCWLVRLFCREFELYARRRDYAESATWQMRLASHARHATQGECARPGPESTVLLLGSATGEPVDPSRPEERTRFALEPNRYRRLRLSYPGAWGRGEACGLRTRNWFPPEGPAIVCWSELTAVALRDDVPPSLASKENES